MIHGFRLSCLVLVLVLLGLELSVQTFPIGPKSLLALLHIPPPLQTFEYLGHTKEDGSWFRLAY